LRIAGRRPYSATLSLIPLAFALAAFVAIAFLLMIAARTLARGGGTSATAVRLTTADAFGLGGLSQLSAGAATATSPVEHNRIVTYYGSPRTPGMGILGQHDPEDAADLLDARAASFRALDPATPLLPALHLVYAVAQPEADRGDLSLRYVDDRTVRQFIDLARRRGFVLILDLQIGHSSALTEVQKIERYLKEPDVFVAIDPEFALGNQTKPGEAVGSIDASDINAVQQYLVNLSQASHLPTKMLNVHQFQQEMIANAEAIERRRDIDLVIDMDGYGPGDIKQVKYREYGAAAYAPFGGIKIFLEHDPNPLTERQLLALDPRPSLFVYQ
jgi:hypothetical protein